MSEVRAMVDSINAAFRAIGVKFRTRSVNGHEEAQMYIPTTGRPVIVTARIAVPSDAVGAMVGKKGALRHGLKKAAKAAAHSKLLKKVGKLLPALSMVVPGGQVLTGAMAAAKVAKAIKAGKKSHNPKTRMAAAKAAVKVKAHVDNLRTSALVPAPGYPVALSAAQPLPSNGFGDSDDVDVEQHMDPQNDTPATDDGADDTSELDDAVDSGDGDSGEE